MNRKPFIQLRSKVSRRILFTVLFCSLLPILGLVSLTLYNVQARLSTDTAQRLHHASKNIGMALMAELSSIEGELKQLAALQEISFVDKQMIKSSTHAEASDPLSAIWMFSPGADITAGISVYTEEIAERLLSGQPHLSVESNETDTSLFLWVPVADIHGQKGIAVGKVNRQYLWIHALGFLPLNTRLIIVDKKYRPLLQSTEEIFVDPDSLQYVEQERGEYTEIDIDGVAWLVGHWDLFLAAGFNSPVWDILVCEPKNRSFAGLISFQKNAGLTGVVTFWIILLASSILVRKTLQPLQKLEEATREVSNGHYNFQLDIKSDDEFETLSDSFNGMVGKIQQQINRQKNMGQAVRAVLGAREQTEIIEDFFKGLSGIVTVEVASLTLFNESVGKNVSVWVDPPAKEGLADLFSDYELVRKEIEPLLQKAALFTYGKPGDFPLLRKSVGSFDAQYFLYFSVKINQSAWVILALADSRQTPSEEEISNVRQLTDQLGVALSRAEMVRELDDLNIGILTALARTVDANSKWTHGHSERVTEYAIIIAKQLGLSEEECEDLHRAGLLHDLGKISIPAEILNKTSDLTAEEMALMEGHPSEGDRILEPIRAFDKIRPFIRHHHERWDGTGYPDGLKGQEIHLGARILAVADVYDALFSDRPYRAGWSHERVVNYLKEKSGSAFDPVVIQAMLQSLGKIPAEDLGCR